METHGQVGFLLVPKLPEAAQGYAQDVFRRSAASPGGPPPVMSEASPSGRFDICRWGFLGPCVPFLLRPFLLPTTHFQGEQTQVSCV